IPLDELNDVLEMDTYPFVFVVPEDLDAVEDLGEDIKDTYEDFDVITGKEMARTVGEMMSNIRLFTFGIGAIAAIVGGLGVMNTMIMAVLERKREIGVFKAIGATNRMVLKQFMIESALLSLIGGATGILLGAAGSLLVGTATPIAPIVTLPLIGGALLFALALGLFGGIYPAMKAAKLDPVEALRYE
ncbi:MAG: FtsX-like permease family protein, partial [Candidatus Aenigmarchaeota archaeon]